VGPLLVLAALVGSMPVLLVRAEGEDLADPFPVQRVRVVPERLSGELKRLGEASFARLPRADFEDMLRRARQNRLIAPPRLLEARYRAQLSEPAPGERKQDSPAPPSLAGTAWWRVVSNGTGPVLLELSGPNQGFNLAVKQPRFENRDALLTWFGPPSSRGAAAEQPPRVAPDEGGPALLIDQPGDQAVTFDWSARAETRPEGIQVDLRLPACPVALLELELPIDRSVAALLPAPEGPLITGPHPAEAADRRLWKVLCGGRSSLPLLIRRGPGPVGEGIPLFARTRTVQRLDPEGLTALYQIDLEARHQGVVELVCACDPVLRPVQVLAPRLDRWKVEPGAPGQPTLLTVRLREPVREGSLQVRCLAPLANVVGPETRDRPTAVTWSSPGLYLQRAIPRGEQLELWLHPDLGLLSWHPGGFRLAGSTFEAGEPSLTAPASVTEGESAAGRLDPSASGGNGKTAPAAPAGTQLASGGKWQRLSLVGGGVELEPGGVRGARPAGTTPVARPELQLKPFAVEFRARQLAWWRIRRPAGVSAPGQPPGSGRGEELIVQIEYDLQAGQLFQLPVELPAGWEVGSVALTGEPGQQLRNYSTRSEKGRSILLVDLLRPLRPAVPRPGAARGTAPRPTLLLRLFPTQPGSVAGRDLPFPDPVPLGARFREGALGIDVDEEVYEARIRFLKGGMRAEVPDASGPWKEDLPGFYRAYQGSRVEGTIHLRVLPPRLRASSRTRVFVAAGRPAGALHTLGAELQVLVEAQRGSPDTLDLVLSTAAGSAAGPAKGKTPPPAGGRGDGPDGWRWQVLTPPEKGANPGGAGLLPGAPRLRRVERWYPGEVGGGLAVLGARTPWQVALFAWATPPGQRWRLTFDKPLAVHQPVQLSATRTLPLGPEPGKGPESSRLPTWEVPLVTVLGAHSFEGEVRLAPLVPTSVQVEGAPDLSQEPIGMSDSAEQGRGWRMFRYHHPTARMVVRGLLPEAVPAHPPHPTTLPEGLLGPARLTTSVSRTGVARHRFGFRVRDWPQKTLPIRLPPGARLLQAFVDGRSLEGVEADPEEGVLELPVPVPSSPNAGGSGGGWRSSWFEVVYTTGQPGRLWPWITLEAPPPSLPAPPTTLEQRWRLPPELAPLWSSRYRPVPGVGEASFRAAPDRRLGLGDLFDPIPSLPWLRFHPTDLALRRQTLADAEAGLRIRFQDDPARKSTAGTRTLGELVEELASGYLKSAHPLVIDRMALEEAGLGRRVVLAVPAPAAEPAERESLPGRDLPGAERGLVALVGHAGILLTTRQQVERWVPTPPSGGLFGVGPSGDELPAALEAPVLEAARDGEDSSGRFCSALVWLASPAPTRLDPLQDPDSGETEGSWSSWNEWEEVPGLSGAAAEDVPALTAVHRNSVTLAGLAVGAGLMVVGAMLTRRRRERLAGNRETSSGGERGEPAGGGDGRAVPKGLSARRLYLLIWLAVAGVALLWLPTSLQSLAWWPLLLGLGFSLAVLLSWGFQTPPGGRPASSRSGMSTASQRSGEGSSNQPVLSPGTRLGLLFLGISLAGVSLANPAAVPGEKADKVYLVPGPAGGPDRETVLAPTALLERLRDAGRPPFAPADSAVLVSATYEGKLIAKAVEFQAVYQVQVLAAAGANLALPLDGVQLHGDVLVDGARTLPVASVQRPEGGPEKTVYLLEVRGPGKHKVELRFRVPVTARGSSPSEGSGAERPDGPRPARDDGRLRSFKFTAPRLLQNRMTLALPADAAHPHVVALHGSQRWTRDASGTRLELELGGLAGPVQVLWYQETRPPREPRVEYRDAWLWDLRVDASQLTGLVVWNVSGAPVTSLELNLPANLEVRSVEAQRAPGSGRDPVAEIPVRLRDWRVERPAAGAHRLHLELAGAVTGGVEVILELVPRGPLAGTLALPLPRPLGAAPAFSYLAYRQDGLEVGRAGWLRVKGIQADRFAPFWPASSRPDLIGLECFEFSREPLEPELPTRLQPPALAVDVTEQVEVQVGAARFAEAARVHGPGGVGSVNLADVRILLTVDASRGVPPVVSWELTRPLTVASITGPEVRRWTRTGNRVTVWLERPAGFSPRPGKGAGASPLRVELLGWLPLTTPPGKPAGAAPQGLELACLRPLFQGTHPTRIHLVSGPGLRLVEKRVRKLQPAGAPSDHERLYESRESDYEGVFEIQPTPSPQTRVWTRVEVRPRRVEFTSTVEVRPAATKGGPRVELGEVLVRVAGWPGEAVQLKAPEGTVLRRHDQKSPKGAEVPGSGSGRAGLVSVPARTPAETRAWWLELQPRQSGPYRLTLTGSLPRNEAGGEIHVPDVTVPSLNEQPGSGGADGERWLELAGDVTPVEVQGLEPSRLPPEAGSRGEHGLVWKVKEENWLLSLPREVLGGDRGNAGARVGLLHAENTAVVGGGGRWLQEAVLWVRHEGHADLNLRWPAPVRILGVSLNGVSCDATETHADPGSPGTTDRLTFHLPDNTAREQPLATGVSCLRVRWRSEEGESSLDSPDLSWPRLEGDEGGKPAGAAEASVVWTVRVPPGWSLAGWQTKGGEVGTPAAVSGSARWALLELGRARVELERSRWLAEHAAERSEALLASQVRFYQAGQHLEQAIDAIPAGRSGRRVVESLGVRASWRELREQNQALAARAGFEAVRGRAERQARTAGVERAAGEMAAWEERLPREGIAVSWQTRAGQEGVNPRLLPVRSRQARQALELSGEWLLLIGLGTVLGLSAGLRTLTRWLAPELLGLVGLFGWQLVGPTVVVVFLLALAGAARGLLLVQRVPRLVRRWTGRAGSR
jgi:hypothetical protein